MRRSGQSRRLLFPVCCATIDDLNAKLAKTPAEPTKQVVVDNKRKPEVAFLDGFLLRVGECVGLGELLIEGVVFLLGVGFGVGAGFSVAICVCGLELKIEVSAERNFAKMPSRSESAMGMFGIGIPLAVEKTEKFRKNAQLCIYEIRKTAINIS